MSRYSFIVEYFDATAAMVRSYQFLFFPADNTIEMFDLKNKRVFLKRCPYPDVKPRDLILGSTITVFSRVLKLVDYGDEATRKAFATRADRVMICIADAATAKAGHVIAAIMSSGATVHKLQLANFAPSVQSALPVPMRRAYVLDCAGEDLAGRVAQWAANGVHCFSEAEAVEVVRFAAFETPSTGATMSNCSVAVIKPHAIVEHGGQILQRIIDEGFEVTAMASFSLSPADSQDFLEVYNGVLPEYKKLVDQFSSGQCWALEVRAEQSVPALRAVCGPHDPEICRALFPDSVRAVYGIDRVRNSIHCTDLPEDGPLESEFFFHLLANKP